MEIHEAVEQECDTIVQQVKSGNMELLFEALSSIEKRSGSDVLMLLLAQRGLISSLVKLMSKLSMSAESDEELEMVDKCAACVAYLSGPTASGPRVRQFDMPDNSTITIREASFTEAYLGWETWNAAIVFAQWICQNRSIIKGANVIELGCGTSLAGIACARYGASHVTLTDHNEAILKYALSNAESNGCGDNTTVSFLDWNDVLSCSPAADAHLAKYDVVIGTDICYNPEHPALLAPVIRKLLSSSRGAKGDSTAEPRKPTLLASVMRLRPEIPMFEEEMLRSGFVLQSKHDLSFSKPDSNIVTQHRIYVYSLQETEV